MIKKITKSADGTKKAKATRKPAGKKISAARRESSRAVTAMPGGYVDWLKTVKERIRSAQLRASIAVNRELVLLYWRIARGAVKPC